MRKLFQRIFAGDKRSALVKKNIVASFVIKAFDTLVYLLLVPLTLGYLNAYEYGIWLTLSSILVWINSFDVGLGNGLRNKLGTALAEGNYEKGRIYVSTTFFMLLFITAVLILFFGVLSHFVDWYSVLNVDCSKVERLDEIVFVSFLFFSLNFMLRFIGNVYQALQLPSVNILMGLGGHLVSLVFIYILTKTVPGNLYWVAIIYSAAFPLVYLISYPITFHRLYPYLAPSFSFFRKDYLKDLLSMSVLFFVLQIMGLVLFSLSNLIISRLFGPEQVTPYNIAHKYFSTIMIFFNFVLSPIWSATTDAYARNDMEWIRTGLSKITKALLLLLSVIFVMFACSDFVYKLWVGNEVHVHWTMSALMGCYIFIVLWSLSYSFILNGMGKLKLQVINIIIVGMFFYPLSYYLSQCFGVNGVLIGMCIANLSGAIFNTVQLRKIFNGTAVGIWNK